MAASLAQLGRLDEAPVAVVLLEEESLHPVGRASRHVEHEDPVGIGDGRARRYQPDISPIAALENPLTAESWAALADIVKVGETIGLFGTRSESVPDGWETEWRYPFLQMICTQGSFRAPISGTTAPTMRELDLSDGAAMVALAGLTQPGPMEARTVTIGRYLGIFDGNASLIAMAPEQMGQAEAKTLHDWISTGGQLILAANES